MKRKVKRYDEGGQTEVVPMPEIEERRREITDYIVEGDKSEESTPTTFKQAFAAARRAGDKTFEFGGKKYTTELAKPKAPKASAPDESSAETSRLARQSKAAETVKSEKRGFGPKLTFNTPEKLEKARKAYYSGFAKGGSVSASKRADGIAQRGKTRGRIC
jgi:hypothetical protein